MTPNFDVTSEQLKLIDAITERAITVEHGAGTRRGDRMAWMMDLCAVCNSCPIDLAALLAADDFNFAHDVFGIRANLNRETGEIESHFTPRFAIRAAA